MTSGFACACGTIDQDLFFCERGKILGKRRVIIQAFSLIQGGEQWWVF